MTLPLATQERSPEAPEEVDPAGQRVARAADVTNCPDAALCPLPSSAQQLHVIPKSSQMNRCWEVRCLSV